MSFGDGNLHAKCEEYKRQVGGLTEALNRARREKAALIVQLHAATDVAALAQKDCGSLEHENAELRALARDMWVKHLGRMDDCAWCVMDCEDGAECAFLKKMKELGVLE